jgi:ribonuclease D
MSISNLRPQVFLCEHDLPDNYCPGRILIVDTERTGLSPVTDRLCLIQILDVYKNLVYFVKIKKEHKGKDFPNLSKVLCDSICIKIMHYALGDSMFLTKLFGDKIIRGLVCTRTMSKLARPYTESHGLATLVKAYTGITLNKKACASD